jgi:hypothetical protein
MHGRGGETAIADHFAPDTNSVSDSCSAFNLRNFGSVGIHS